MYKRQALVRRKVIEQAKEVILTADSSKFGRDVLAHICPISAVDLIITDDKLPDIILSRFEDANVNIVLS